MPKIFWLLIPAVIFLVVVVFFVSQMPPAEKNSTEATTAAQPAGIKITPTTTQKTPAQQLMDKLNAYQAEDSALTAPNFSTEISLPEE